MPSLRRCGAFLFLIPLLLSSACADLDILNYNDPDTERSLMEPGDIVSLIATSYNTWFQANYGWPDWDSGTPGLFLSNQALQHASPWANLGMDQYGRIPRVGLVNNVLHESYEVVAWPWHWGYRALGAVNDGFRAMERVEIAEALGDEEVIRLRAFGRFVQGLALGTIAIFYDRGFDVDETADLNEPQSAVNYQDLMDAALNYLEEAAATSEASEFTLPFEWMSADLNSQEFARVIRSYKARLRAQVARTPDERREVDWGSVVADVDAGIRSDFLMHMHWTTGWWNNPLVANTLPGWSGLPYFMYGMADQVGDVAKWLNLPTDEKTHLLPDGRPVLIVSSDLRFPRGSSVEEQRANPGTYFRIVSADEAGNTWQKPERGTWRWSWYKAGYDRGLDYYLGNLDQPEITLEEMRLLKAEGLYWQGDLAGTAEIINETRTRAGLNATDPTGTNTSCVPRLPDGSCGDLWEMLKWEKRMETVWTGIAGVGWFFDGRGWGDLFKDTPLQFPVPCQELHILQMLPCNTYGGPGGEMSAPVSTYRFPDELG